MPSAWGVEVRQAFNGSTVGAPSGPAVLLQVIIPARRVGWIERMEIFVDGAEDMKHRETQWLETTLQVSAVAPSNPEDPDYLNKPTASDICLRAAHILQSDRGLLVMGAHRVRPLRITDLRTVQFVNDADQYEVAPSFDLVLSHVQIIEGATPPVAQITGAAGSV